VIQKGEIGVVVERVIAGSPAKDGNLLPNDIIVKANGTELKDLTLPDAVSKIR
jgi:C-terminal processing protease CtpA/Prc